MRRKRKISKRVDGGGGGGERGYGGTFSFADVPLARPEEKTLGLKNAQECENFRFKNNFGFSE